jgi:putative ABC transport system permease protein
VRPLALLREVAASARAQRVPTALVAVLVAAMCLTAILTVGRAAAAQRQVQHRLEDAGSRQIEVTDQKGKGFLTPATVGAAATMDTVERAVGVTLPRDTTNVAVGAGGTPVPYWQVVGSLRDVAVLTSGRWPNLGEAVASDRALAQLGLDEPAGAVSAGPNTAAVAVVGTFRARAPFDTLDAGLVGPAAPGTPAHALDVVVRAAPDAELTQAAVLALLARPDPTDVTVRSPRTLAEVQADVLGDLARYDRALLLAVLATGAALVAAVTLGDVLLRRRDLGRRRALGATRGVLTTLVVARAALGGLVGAALGCLCGVALAARVGGAPGAGFVVGTGLLAVLSAAVAAVGPAVVAARQDPVRVLRTP